MPFHYHHQSRLQSEPHNARIVVWALTISLAATLVIDVSFSSSGYLDVSVHRVPRLNLWIQLRLTRVFLVRFPHSEICGSMCICHSPQLFAAYHVFHRLLVPRHPPCALIASSNNFESGMRFFLISECIYAFEDIWKIVITFAKQTWWAWPLGLRIPISFMLPEAVAIYSYWIFLTVYFWCYHFW